MTQEAGAEDRRTVNLALQGGGAHGAFAWGVLDRLLGEERLAFEGISATSAGAMNAAVLAHGMAAGGRVEARRSLERFWRLIAEAASFSPLQPSPIDRLLGNHGLDFSPAFLGFELATRMLSPYQFNPCNINPLRSVLEEVVDFELVRRQCPLKLFFSATNVRTGKVRIFENPEITADAVLASACLPFLFQAVEIDGEAYWDGGYMGNPAIFPLIYGCQSRDVVIVHINPIERPGVPRTAEEIMNRLNEISFNSSLMREMRAIAFVTRLIDEGEIQGARMKRMLIHGILSDAVTKNLPAMSKMNADWGFLTHLRELGREHAAAWLEASFERLGRESTVDVRALYL
ncbi:patatin-like phospholipase family protein [Marinimicrococcus flavescens]|uniref:Patatin-like phospholipase family protein n=1 Tax=Marinimicrococcus flavescens TaxID=3031815 RepID=A0AAP3V060_9PROT|nr:patatin-like phospholipase family protein [Marinimicrococcus flavescens]